MAPRAVAMPVGVIARGATQPSQATGVIVALCPGGAFADNVVANPSHVLVVKSVYTCDDGSGTFNAITELRSTPGPDDSVTTTGTVQLLGGTGAFTNLIGHGTVIGFANFATETAGATDTGVVTRI